MKLTFLALLLVAAAALSAAQTLKLQGHWQRLSCSCSNAKTNGNCDDIWITDYPQVLQTGGTTFTGMDTAVPPIKNLVIQPGTGPEWQLAGPIATGLGYDCHGAIGKMMKCEDFLRTTDYCDVQFVCVDGDCATSLGAQNMRSIMFPIVGALIAVVWLLLSFLKGLPLPLLTMILSLVIFVLCLFLLVAPLVWLPLATMAFAALAFAANKSENSFEIKLAAIAGIFLFLAWAGLNSLAGQTFNFFDNTLDGFYSNSCYTYYGLDLMSPRCAQYLLFTGFLGYLIMMLIPLLVITLLARVGAGDK